MCETAETQVCYLDNNVSGSQAKVTDLHVILGIQENVDWLQVSVDHPLEIKHNEMKFKFTFSRF